MARPTITIPINNGSQTPSRPIVSGYDSPRAGSESPPPEGPQGALEAELLELTHALYNLGTTTILDVTQDAPPGGKPVGARVNDVIRALGAVDAHADGPLAGLNVPINVLREVDAGQNPEKVTREAVDRAVSENQFMNGKIRALQAYSKELDEALVEAFPDLAAHLLPNGNQPTTSSANPDAAAQVLASKLNGVSS